MLLRCDESGNKLTTKINEQSLRQMSKKLKNERNGDEIAKD